MRPLEWNRFHKGGGMVDRSGRHVGLVGLGLMGRGMGMSLLRAGFRLGIVAHRRRETAEELCASGAWEAANAAELATDCDTVVLCLPSLDTAQAVLLGPSGVSAGAGSGLLVVECSTLRPDAAVDFDRQLAASGIAFVDAPVTRGPAEAEAGKLNALVGGRPAAVARADPVLRAFCAQVFAMGGPGQGYAAKLVNNFLAFSSLVAVSEAMATAGRAGLHLPTLLQAISASGGQNRVLDGLTPWLAGIGEPRSRVTLATAHKDIDYYNQFAAALGTGGPVAAQVLERLKHALEVGLGEHFTPDYLRHVARE
ncbi:MAG: NAD(P)-dependent oxidoreductase [Ramlibacter sp.]